MKKRFQLLALSALCVLFAHAQYVAPSEGVFRIINVGYDAALMEDFLGHKLYCTANIGDNDDYEQLWVLRKSGSGYSLQNVFTGAYIQTGNTGTEVNYWTGSTAKTFNIVAAGDAYNIFDSTLGSQGLHSKGANGNVVRWVDCDPSRWKFVKVNLTEQDMAAARAEYERLTGGDNVDAYQTVLDEVFTDKACTVLSEAYASKSVAEIEAALADKLPAGLVEMAVKIKNDSWAEDNEKEGKPGWSAEYAKKFRVQMIEPYSIAGEITEWIGHQGHTNMDNPTGLYANKRQVLYIMVEGEIKEGSELWATWLVGHTKMPNYNNGYSNGIRLKEGLNIVPFGSDGSALYFNYLVHTFDKNTWEFAHKLSDFDDIKIHVEGGYINGYYNLVGDALYKGDTDADWVYYEDRANLENITILGRYQVLQFELNDVIGYQGDKDEAPWDCDGLAKLFPEKLPQSLPENQRINAIINSWDRIHLSEKMTLGVASKADVDSMNVLCPRYDADWKQKAEIYNYDDELLAFCNKIKERDGDYGEYYNHHGLAFGTRSGYMYGSWDHCGYHINTTPSILTGIATEAGSAWGPGHEIGHQHQALYTLNGEMEVTNNTFANVAVWYMGLGTSRMNGTQGNLHHVYENFKNGGRGVQGMEGDQGYLLTNNIWALTQRYYRLWLYYHRAGNNTQFYPRLFELLRQYPMERSYGSGSEMRPNDKGVMESVGFQRTNGGRSYLHFYRLCCEAAQEDLTEFFRAYGCFEPVNGVFQGDYTNSKYYTTQEEIDSVIALVKAKKYPVNNLPLFINDGTADITYGHDGKTPRSYWDGETESKQNGELGCYVDFLAKNPITGGYKYDLNSLKLTISEGDGAVGFAVFDEKNEIQAFSNNHSFELSDSVFAHVAIYNDYKVYAIAPDGTQVEIPLTDKKGALSGSYQYTLTENKIMISGGQNALAYAIYDGDTMVAMLKGASFEATDDISYGLATGKLVARAHGINGSSVVVPVMHKEMSGDFYYTLKGNTVKVAGGKNALCYVVCDAEGNVQDYSGTPSFDVADELIQALVTETSSVIAIGTQDATVKVRLELESFFRASLKSAQGYVDCADATFTKVGMFYPDSVKALAALVEKASGAAGNSEFSKWIVTLDSASNALLENKGARIPLTPDCFYSIAITGRVNSYLGTVEAGLNHPTSVREINDNVQWRIIPAEGASTYYLLNRETGKYVSVLADGSRVEASSSNIKDAKAVKLVALDTPGDFFIQAASGSGINLYNDTRNRVYASKTVTDNTAKWTLRLEESMLEQPKTCTSEQMTLYYLQRTDNSYYAKYTSSGRTGTGRIGSNSSIDTKSSKDFWFYFTPGNAEGKYAIYSYATGLSLTVDAKNKIFANVETEETVDYSLVLDEENAGLVISSEVGNWYMSGTYAEADATRSTAWKVQRAHVVSGLTMSQNVANVTVGKALALTAQVTTKPVTELSAAWSSSDEAVAIVDANGNVTGVAKGSATITATVGTLKTTCVVTVSEDTGIASVANDACIQSLGGQIVVNGLNNGTVVSIYDAAGSLIGTAVATNGAAAFNTGLAEGNTVIVKVGDHSMKVTIR